MSDFGERLRQSVPDVAGQTALLEPPRRPPQVMSNEDCQAAERRYAEAEAAAEALVRDVFRPLVEEFQKVMEAGSVLLPGSLTEGRIPCGAHWCAYKATGSAHQARGKAPKRRDYYVRVSAAAFRGGPVELSVECRHGASRDCRYSLPRTPLVEFDPPSISADESARQWCADLLEQCAQACRDANSVPASSHAAGTSCVAHGALKLV
jgi:hypothetical protein